MPSPETTSVEDFYPRPPRGGRPPLPRQPAGANLFLSTPSARRATSCPDVAVDEVVISIHALREEGDRVRPVYEPPRVQFLSTPSARRATKLVKAIAAIQNISIHALREEGDLPEFLEELRKAKISIHALREEGDVPFRVYNKGVRTFLSTPSARRATVSASTSGAAALNFYPRPPRGGRPLSGWSSGRHLHFYPRPPRGGRLSFSGFRTSSIQFLSTPSARRATVITERTVRPLIFLSTPSARRATYLSADARQNYTISIHALREEGDLVAKPLGDKQRHFYPRPPRGGRHGKMSL